MWSTLRPAQQFLIDVTVDLLINDPAGWEFRPHVGEHKRSGIELWMSHRFYGTHIRAAGVYVGGNDSDIEPPWQRKWRRGVVRLADAVAADHLHERLKRQLEPVG